MMRRTADALAIFYDFIEAPVLAAEETRAHPPVAFGALGYILAAMSVFLAQAVYGEEALLGLSWFSLSLTCVWNLGTGFLLAAVVHLFAESLGGRGRVVPLFVLLGFSELAWAVFLPGVFIVQAVLPESRWALKFLFVSVGTMTLLLKARSIRHNYRFGSLPAWISLLAPYAAVALSLTLLTAAALWGLIHQILKVAA